MSDRMKKENTPPPLLLMPAGGGLTLTPPEQPNVLMPVIQSVPNLLDPEEEAEADSFVGQSLSPPSQSQQGRTNQQPENYFQPNTSLGYDPFAQIGPGQPPASMVPTFNPAMSGVDTSATPPVSSTYSPASTQAPPGPPSNTPGSGNIYRHKGGRPQYALPPTGSHSLGPPPGAMYSQPPSSAGPLPPTAMVPPMPNLPPTNQVPPTASIPPINAFNRLTEGNAAPYTGGLFYTPVRHHWCYRQDQNDIEMWRTFSVLDSMQLELAYSKSLRDEPGSNIIVTNGGRYDVNISRRIRTPVYWDEASTEIKRCSWFYKREGDNRYIPYEEEFASKLEDEYKKAMETGGWHRRLEFPGNIIIVMHSANVIVQFPASSAPDEWGNIQNVYSLTGDQMRPRVVKRGVDDFSSIEYGERQEVDHLVFFVPGIEDMSQPSGKSVEMLVDDFRSNALTLVESHFSQAFQAKIVNRAEFLPIVWTQALKDGTSGLKSQVSDVTLPSTSKLRHFINNTLLDTLFYTSPQFAQNICETVGNEMNRIFHIFLERNQSFSGDVSVAGHSLGSMILFDLLANQRLPGEFRPPDFDVPADKPQAHLAVSEQPSETNGEISANDGMEEDLSLEALLSQVGLQDKASLFEQEQIDIESLIMCSEQDLKDIGLPMGPRKKLLGFLKEEQDRKQSKLKDQAEKKIKEEREQKQLQARVAEEALNNSHSPQPPGGYMNVQYMLGQCGAGQLKIKYPQLDFSPSHLFALGSPIAVFLSLRGVQEIGEFFQLPTCPRVINVFHPYDPMAYRLEPLIRANTVSVKPVQIPHYKGRKRLHLEFKEAVTRYGTDIKQKIVDSFKSTWNTLNEFARAHTSSQTMQTEVQSEMDQMMSHIAQQHSEDDKASVSSAADEDIHMGQLNEGQRVDYVLQEGPLESFNDYLFALASHSCYWESEDTALMLLKEIYAPIGIRPVMPGTDSGRSSKESSLPPRQSSFPGAPPVSGFPPPPGSAMQTPTYPQSPPTSNQAPPTSFPPPALNDVGSAPPNYQNPGLSQSQASGPPSMFSPQNTMNMTPGVRKSPYVAPDFNNLPPSQGAAPAGPPPMGPAIVGGYRRMPLK